MSLARNPLLERHAPVSGLRLLSPLRRLDQVLVRNRVKALSDHVLPSLPLLPVLQLLPGGRVVKPARVPPARGGRFVQLRRPLLPRLSHLVPLGQRFRKGFLAFRFWLLDFLLFLLRFVGPRSDVVRRHGGSGGIPAAFLRPLFLGFLRARRRRGLLCAEERKLQGHHDALHLSALWHAPLALVQGVPHRASFREPRHDLRSRPGPLILGALGLLVRLGLRLGLRLCRLINGRRPVRDVLLDGGADDLEEVFLARGRKVRRLAAADAPQEVPRGPLLERPLPRAALRAAGQVEELAPRQHGLGGLVELPGLGVPPSEQAGEDGQLLRVVRHPLLGVVVQVGRLREHGLVVHLHRDHGGLPQHQAGEVLRVALGELRVLGLLRHQLPGPQVDLQPVVDVQQEVGVRPRVRHQVVREGPHPPVRHLVPLVGVIVAIVLEQEGEAELGEVEGPRRLPRVEQVRDVDPVVPLQPHDVRVRAVDDLDLLRVREDVPQGGADLVPQRQAVHDEVLPPRGHLHEAKESLVRVQRVVLQVHRDHGLLVEFLGQDLEEGLVVHVRERRGLEALEGLSLVALEHPVLERHPPDDVAERVGLGRRPLGVPELLRPLQQQS
mmetsp:Transcript_5276/g.15850  ORF Transcript_5276/g.15850 Transcript_5276/m.15850 type:complete len:609 (-) Transcript_5276:827-2653(-)